MSGSSLALETPVTTKTEPHTATAMPQSNITDPNTKRQAAREVLDILSEISTLLVRNPNSLPQPPPFHWGAAIEQVD